MSRPRRGLVLGAGGVLGAAWMIGALCALEEETGLVATKADLLLGTSAGSVVAALLAAGVSPEEQRAHQRGEVLDGSPLAGVEFDYALGGRPPTPWPGVGSARLLAAIVRDRRLLSAPVVLAGLLPRGRGSINALAELVDQVVPSWPKRPELQVVAMDYDAGRRVVFGAASNGAMPPSKAVTASCAIPGWFAPVEIDGRVYVDGGTTSIASADLLAGRKLDEVYVLAPLAWLASPESMGPSMWMLQHWRRALTRQLSHEVEQLRAEGTRVTILAPSAEDLVILGPNPMDEHRRLEVLETSLRTSRAAVRSLRHRRTPHAGSARAVRHHRAMHHATGVSKVRRRGGS
ncbi:patatin-like phospholipase family protein [Actinopolymorpha alba]|uniref:patatin-like phospholipase family protein n=1 Tax=Actinopolymorpha alba TaxID=533267 RepID=UPI00037AB62E|nr:patatin-like phospholipase family protein [Actinopolymorpha alba]